VKLRAVVVNYNGGDLVLRAVASLTVGAPVVDEIVVVDNDSSDGSPDAIRTVHPAVRVIDSGANLGFGRAANLALRDLRGVDGVVLLNPDAEAGPGWLAPLTAALARDGRLGAACPKILFAGREPPVVNNAGNVVRPGWNAHDRGFGDPDDGRWDTAGEVTAWCGGAVLLRADYLRDVGLFDERLFLYYEDVELSVRGARRGWRYWYEPTSVVLHAHAQSTRAGSALFERENTTSRLVVAGTWGTTITRSLAWLQFGAGVVRRGAGEALHGQLRMPAARRRLGAAGAARRLVRRGPDVPFPVS